ncbi:hypothetical protein DW616_15910, partial [Enterococcus faecalis]|nr:hypothetical protein [Enterococcus faecalis]
VKKGKKSKSIFKTLILITSRISRHHLFGWCLFLAKFLKKWVYFTDPFLYKLFSRLGKICYF